MVAHGGAAEGNDVAQLQGGSAQDLDAVAVRGVEGVGLVDRGHLKAERDVDEGFGHRAVFLRHQAVRDDGVVDRLEQIAGGLGR